MVERDDEAVRGASGEMKVLRRRDRLLPALVERQRLSGITRDARNILAKHHHAVADIAPAAAQDRIDAAARWRSDTDGRNIARIRAMQEGRAAT